ncbi:MAG: tRNA (adenosine(37)-N6)-threonylcarbamoyltransferase complex transferase subunit TsaD, partial [Oscillospiraceae bacterium]|jgi:N6-L-threonylcarbamoyladenine synthase|nr:tRNA (adenosine(37)-N6)-threonylcarbamoyltransferase complex transferase subunit TsaD [Oscillospiraceae bacterium]
VVASQVEEHKIYGGVVPEIASRRHAESISSVVDIALRKAYLEYEDIDAVAVTYAPGLIGALLVGVNFAKGLSFSLGRPLIPVHHLRSHIAANYLAHSELRPPFLALVVSGGHSHIVHVKSYTGYEILGKTADDAAGEALDKAARAMGIPYPGGANLDVLTKGGDSKAFAFPRPRVDGRPLDFSFSGLKTAVVNMLHKEKQRGGELDVKDLGASYIAAVVQCLTENVMTACEQTGVGNLALAGGVSANSVLRGEMARLCEEKGVQLFLPPLSLCGDNAAMVGAQGYYEFLSGTIAGPDLNAYATKAMDEG